MSDTPPKPKPGSLRDRIAAFENANKGAAPAPRPKPSTLQSWKPKVPSPPQSPEPERKTAGMSASDAMESIGKGGSLKERMAALQGRGAFGGGAPPPILPKPADKPRWKPPPPVSPPADEAISQGGEIDAQGSSPPATGDPDPTDLEGEHEAQQDAAEIEQDPEEEERQRRAAIAARMARLGGARVGMGPPPLFVAKPAPKKPVSPPPQPKQDEEATLQDSEVTSPPAEAILSPPVDIKEEAQIDPDHFPSPTRKDSDSSSFSLTDSPSNAATTRSMPVPAGPRRAAPPRKKVYKSPPASQLSEVPVPDVAPEVSEEAPDVEPIEEPATEPAAEPELELKPEARSSVVNVTSQEIVESPEQVPVPSAEQILVIGDVQNEIGEVGVSVELDTADVDPTNKLEDENYRMDADVPMPGQQDQDEGEQEQEEQEHDECKQKEEEVEAEEARRHRVALGLAHMSASNPLARPPHVPRHDSIPSSTTRRDSITAQPASVEELLDVGEATPSPPAAHISPHSHSRVEEELEKAKEAREVDEPASRAAEFNDGSQPDLGATRRVLYHDEIDEQEQYDGSDRLLNEPDAWEPASQPHALDASLLPSNPVLPEFKPGQGDPNHPGTSAQDEEAVLTDAVDSAPSTITPEVLASELTPDQHQDDDEMAPARIMRPIPPPPVNLSSKPSFTPSSPPSSPPLPPRLPYALQLDEERPESPAPRPVPPPVKSVKAAEGLPTSPPRVARRTSASVKSLDIVEEPPAPPPRVARRTSASVRSASGDVEEPPSPPPRVARRCSSVRSGDIEEEPPHPPPRIARRTSASVKSMELEGLPTPPPVPTSPRPSLRRPTSPPIITALPLTVPVTTNEEDAEQEFSDIETPSQPQRVQEPEEEDEDSVRKRTIAERMARLGGIQFGVPPVPTPLTRPTFPRAPPPTSIPPDEPEFDAKEPDERDETVEDEAARKQRIAAKLAGMGGMRFGMLPPGAGVAPATARRLAPKQDDSENEDAALPVPAPAHPGRRPLPPVEVDPEQEYRQTRSEDGVRVDMEESEVDDVYYSDVDVREPVEEEGPPLPPPRRSSLTLGSADVLPTPPPRSPPPIGRPAIPFIPTALLNRRTSVATGSSSRKSSVDYSSATDTPVQTQRIDTALPLARAPSDSGTQSEYVMVEPESEAEEEPLAPPPRRSIRAPPRSLPPPPPPSAIDPPGQMTSTAQWELPSIPQAASEFDDEADLASSRFSEDSTFHGSTSTPTRKSDPRHTSGQTARPIDQQLSADELMALWGKVGVQVVESATKLFEQSKRSLVGDGSYAGFVKAAFAQVPDAQRVSGEGEDWGYLIYVQTAGSVQRRIADILPGDVIAFWDAKLKGHKGLHTYSQTVGAGENGPLVGVVSEVESKKSKVRVWQANQHVGQQVSLLRRWRRRANGVLTPKATQTVENASYRLEDLKSGVVKVFRVMEA